MVVSAEVVYVVEVLEVRVRGRVMVSGVRRIRATKRTVR
jgi:hypothetical protein